jgi:hypothetical protein
MKERGPSTRKHLHANVSTALLAVLVTGFQIAPAGEAVELIRIVGADHQVVAAGAGVGHARGWRRWRRQRLRRVLRFIRLRSRHALLLFERAVSCWRLRIDRSLRCRVRCRLTFSRQQEVAGLQPRHVRIDGDESVEQDQRASGEVARVERMR